jgi:hypothetical protein
MSTKQFFLLGEAQSTSQEIEIPAGTDEQTLQHLVASHFAIVDPNGKPAICPYGFKVAN